MSQIVAKRCKLLPLTHGQTERLTITAAIFFNAEINSKCIIIEQSLRHIVAVSISV